MTPTNVTKMRQDTVELLEMASDLWDNVCSVPPPSNVNDLWKEHLRIRDSLDKMQAVNPTELNFPNRRSRKTELTSFLSWCIDDAKIEAQKVTVDLSPSLGGDALSLKAASDVEADETIVKVPRSAMITWDNVLNCSALQKAMENDPILVHMDNVALAVFVLCEKLRGKQSDWYPYINVLPESYSTPLFFTKEQMELLRPSPMFESALKMYRSIMRQFIYFFLQLAPTSRNEAKNALTRSNLPTSGKGSLLAKTPLSLWNFTFDAYRWAVATVSTRINMVPSATVKDTTGNPRSVPALIPYLDMANHHIQNNQTQPRVSVNFDVSIDAAVFRSDVAYVAGDEVFFNYGARSDADHLLHNGFVPAECDRQLPACFTIKFGLSKTDQHHSLRSSALNSLGLSDTEEFSLSCACDSNLEAVIPDRMLRFIQVFVCPVTDGCMNEATDSATNQRRAWKYLLDRFQLLLKTYDRSLMKMKELNGDELNVCMIERLLLAEKAVLEQASDCCQLHLAKIVE